MATASLRSDKALFRTSVTHSDPPKSFTRKAADEGPGGRADEV